MRNTGNSLMTFRAKHALVLHISLMAAAIAPLTSVGARSGDAASSVTAFVNVNIIPMDREVILPAQTVVVRNGRISRIGRSETIQPPDDAKLIDGTGKFLMPGLADMHVHVWDVNEFPLYLANGVTTVRNMFGAPIHLEWRHKIENGELLGPTIYTAGPIIDGKSPVWPGSAIVATPEDAELVVASQKMLSYDFLTVYWGLSRSAYDAVLEAAKTHGIRVAGHVPDRVGLDHVFQTRLKSIEHLTGYDRALQLHRPPQPDESIWARLDESKFSEIAERTKAARIWNCPTLVVYQKRIAADEVDAMFARSEMKYVSAKTRESWRPENNYLRNMTPAQSRSIRAADPLRKKLVKALHDAGARLLLGTDSPNPFVVPGFAIHEELQNLRDAGLTPFEALRTGTADAGRFISADPDFGTVTVGLRADLLLLDADPLTAPDTLRDPAGVMTRGRWLPRPDLKAGLDALLDPPAELSQRDQPRRERN